MHRNKCRATNCTDISAELMPTISIVTPMSKVVQLGWGVLSWVTIYELESKINKQVQVQVQIGFNSEKSNLSSVQFS